MRGTLTPELLDELRGISAGIVAEVIERSQGSPADSSVEGRKLVNESLFLMIGLRIVVPIINAVTGSLIKDFLKERWFAGKSRADLEKEAEANIGKPLHRIDPEEREICILLVEQALAPTNAPKLVSARIVDLVTERIYAQSNLAAGPK